MTEGISPKLLIAKREKELDLEEAFDLWEIVQVNRYNEYLAIEHSKKKSGRR